ncbi:MAG: two-component system, CitB family, sensor kinase [Frankiales bacterium]|jgi:two-component system CitB family sensor kinase|nr:two-component system, CitB family, sensor kinase [Frankiales bacterium]
MQAKRWSVARQLLALQTLLLLTVFAAAAATTLAVDRGNNQAAARDKVLVLAESIAANPFVVQQATARTPTVALEPYAEQIRLETGVNFVVIMAPSRTRWTHPNRSLIGQPFIGTIEPALQGRAFTETYTGTLGASVRAVAPVRNADGKVVALVSDGITTEAIHAQLWRQLPILLTALGLLLAVAMAGAVLVSRRLRRQTRGLDADTIAKMVASHEAVLHSIREGLVVTDRIGRIGLMNDEARRLLNAEGDMVGQPVDRLAIAQSIKDLLTDARTADDELHLTGERVLVVNQLPAQWEGRRYGTVTTLRDRTELESLTGELNTTKALAESLRSQAHETANRLHTMIVLVETGRGEDAVRYATKQLELSQRLTDRLFEAIDEPVLAALLLGKTAQAGERGVELTVDVQGAVTFLDLPASDLVTVVGNLVDNAIDASAQAQVDRRVDVTIGTEGNELLVQVADSGPGLPGSSVDLAFTRGWSTKVSPTTAGRGLGLALVNQVVRRHHGTVTVASSDSDGAHFSVRLPLPGKVVIR